MIRKIMKFVNPAPQLWGWVKAHEKELALFIGVLLASLISFAAGYLVAKDQLKTPVTIEQTYEEIER